MRYLMRVRPELESTSDTGYMFHVTFPQFPTAEPTCAETMELLLTQAKTCLDECIAQRKLAGAVIPKPNLECVHEFEEGEFFVTIDVEI